MGRTIPTYRMVLEEEIASWRGFAKALREEERLAFEDMLNICRLYASASSAAVRPTVSEAMFMALLLTHHKRLRELEKRLDLLTARIDVR